MTGVTDRNSGLAFRCRRAASGLLPFELIFHEDRLDVGELHRLFLVVRESGDVFSFHDRLTVVPDVIRHGTLRAPPLYRANPRLSMADAAASSDSVHQRHGLRFSQALRFPFASAP